MTKREFLNTISTAENLSAELTEFAAAELAKMDAANNRRSSKPSKTQIANEPIKADILAYLSEKPDGATAAVIAEDVESVTSTQKATGICRGLVQAGVLDVEDVKVPKKGVQKKYTIHRDDVEVQSSDED